MVNELYHWGIKGQKWGVRRYQNEDGTLTEEGKKRYGYDPQKGVTKIDGPFMTTKRRNRLIEIGNETLRKDNLDDLNGTLLNAEVPSSVKSGYIKSLMTNWKNNPSSEDSNNSNDFKLNVIGLLFDGHYMDVLEKAASKLSSEQITNSFGMVHRLMADHLWTDESKKKWQSMLSVRSSMNKAFANHSDQYESLKKQHEDAYKRYIVERAKELNIPTDRKTVSYLLEIERMM